MTHHIARLVSPARLAAMALSALCFMETPVHAQYTVHAYQVISAGGNVGLTRGQTLRYTWVNLDDPLQTREFELLGIQVKVLGANGVVIAQAESPVTNARASQSFDFIRDAISLPGEPGTGRLQLRLEVAVKFATAPGGELFDIEQQILGAFDDQAEVIDTLTGRTTVSFKPKEIVVVGSKPASAADAAILDAVWIDPGSPVGIAREQTLRISVFNPLVPQPGDDVRKYKMLVAPLILNADGQVIARQAEMALAPGQSHSFDFGHADLLMAGGEPGTARLQVRSEIRRRFFPGITARISQGGVDYFPETIELVDQGTGRTMLLVPAIQAAREAARRIN